MEKKEGFIGLDMAEGPDRTIIDLSVNPADVLQDIYERAGMPIDYDRLRRFREIGEELVDINGTPVRQITQSPEFFKAEDPKKANNGGASDHDPAPRRVVDGKHA